MDELAFLGHERVAISSLTSRAPQGYLKGTSRLTPPSFFWSDWHGISYIHNSVMNSSKTEQGVFMSFNLSVENLLLRFHNFGGKHREPQGTQTLCSRLLHLTNSIKSPYNSLALQNLKCLIFTIIVAKILELSRFEISVGFLLFTNESRGGKKVNFKNIVKS